MSDDVRRGSEDPAMPSPLDEPPLLGAFERIYFTPHAVERLRQRYPELTLAAARVEIRVALLIGRHSDAPPYDFGTLRDRDATYVWDAAASRCYILRPTPSGALVKTILPTKAGSPDGPPLRSGLVRAPA